MFSIIKYTLFSLAFVAFSSMFIYNKYIEHEKNKEIMIRKDERLNIEKEIKEAVDKAKEEEHKKVLELRNRQIKTNKSIDEKAAPIKEQIKKSNSEKELNNSFKDILSCLEKSC